MFKFGITMRETNAIGYDEPRDTLAQDWAAYMSDSFPAHNWLSIPNTETEAVEFFKNWNLNVLVLSGGDDIGKTLKRDRTELLLLKHALDNNIPVIGVCRGLQLIHSYFGGQIVTGSDSYIEEHRAHDHYVSLNNETYLSNSFHVNQLDEKTLSKDFDVLARCVKHNSIEAIQKENVLAVMWHPERKMEDKSWSNNLIYTFLKNYE